jgi:putative ABC transport system permease protein
MRKIRPLDGLIEALGATGADIHRMVLWQGLRLGLAGTLLGLAAAFVAARALEGYLYGIGEHDPGSFAAATFVLLTAALFSRLLPARRAGRSADRIARRVTERPRK